MRRRTAALVLTVVLAVAGCSDDPSTVERSSSGSTSDPADATASATPSASATPTATASPDADDQGGPAFSPASTTSQEAGTGNGLSVVDVRTGTHDGYDRVVFELGGQGTAGWRVAYDDAPVTQGQGAPVELAGDATLTVVIENVGYPFDTGVPEYAGDRNPAPGHPQVQELQLGGVFEGYYDAFVGTAERAPFRVFRLSDPQRIVVDVQH